MFPVVSDTSLPIFSTQLWRLLCLSTSTPLPFRDDSVGPLPKVSAQEHLVSETIAFRTGLMPEPTCIVGRRPSRMLVRGRSCVGKLSRIEPFERGRQGEVRDRIDECDRVGNFE
jgi:hypothetical protein